LIVAVFNQKKGGASVFVKVVYCKKSVEVMIEDGGDVGKALDASGLYFEDEDEMKLMVTGVPVCPGPPLRPGDVLVVRPY